MNSGAIAGGAIAVIAEAIKASGAIVRVDPEGFLNIISRSEKPLVVMAKGGFLNKSFDYLTGYKGLVFYSRSNKALYLPGDSEIVSVKQIWIPY